MRNIESDLLKEAEAAQYLGLERNTLSVWRSNGRVPLPFIRIGARVRYRMSDLQRFLDDNTVGQVAGVVHPDAAPKRGRPRKAVETVA